MLSCGEGTPVVDPDGGLTLPDENPAIGEPCTNDAECGAGLACVAGFCSDSTLGGRPCVRTGDCRAEEYCDIITGQCKACDALRCRTDAGPADAGPVDSGPVDSGPVDSGPVDSGPVDSGPVDSGPVDSGPPDSGPVDSGPVDSGPVDSGPVDSGPVDSGPRDSGPVDSGPVDSGPVDSGPRDSGPPDSGPVDSGPVDAGPVDSGPPVAPLPGELRFNEVFAYPYYDTPPDDPNRDGWVDEDDEFIELVNVSTHKINISGFSIWACDSSDYWFSEGDCFDLCLQFPANTILDPKKAVVIFSRTWASTPSTMGGSRVFSCGSSGWGLDIDNTATRDYIEIDDVSVTAHWTLTIPRSTEGESVVWYPEATAQSQGMLHTQVPNAVGYWSPGTRANGTSF